MRNFFENVFSGVGITDVIDIIIVAFVIYKLLGLIKQTRAEQLKLAAQRRRDAGSGSNIGGFPAGTEACP